MKLELYYYKQCPFCLRVLFNIKRLGITKIDYCNTLENPEHYKRHLEATGRSTVPCLYIDGNPMFESSDIIDWLEANAEKLK